MPSSEKNSPLNEAGPGGSDVLMMFQRLTAWIERRQRDYSDELHQASDALADAQDWTITRTTDVFGCGARTYRDPRFDQLKAQRAAAAEQESSGAAVKDQVP